MKKPDDSNPIKERESNIENQSNVAIYDNDDAYILNDDGSVKDEVDDLYEDGYDQSPNNRGNHMNNNNNDNDNNDIHNIESPFNEKFSGKENEDDVQSLNSNNSNNANNLVNLKIISFCQSCRASFNQHDNTPLLMKCGHFFCRSCIMGNFTDEQGKVFCPVDGPIAVTIKQLKVLTNLIIDQTVDEEQIKLDNQNEDSQSVSF